VKRMAAKKLALKHPKQSMIEMNTVTDDENIP
jgi:hypothetical protein